MEAKHKHLKRNRNKDCLSTSKLNAAEYLVKHGHTVLYDIMFYRKIEWKYPRLLEPLLAKQHMIHPSLSVNRSEHVPFGDLFGHECSALHKLWNELNEVPDIWNVWECAVGQRIQICIVQVGARLEGLHRQDRAHTCCSCPKSHIVKGTGCKQYLTKKEGAASLIESRRARGESFVANSYDKVVKELLEAESLFNLRHIAYAPTLLQEMPSESTKISTLSTPIKETLPFVKAIPILHQASTNPFGGGENLFATSNKESKKSKIPHTTYLMPENSTSQQVPSKPTSNKIDWSSKRTLNSISSSDTESGEKSPSLVSTRKKSNASGAKRVKTNVQEEDSSTHTLLEDHEGKSGDFTFDWLSRNGSLTKLWD